MAVSRRSRDSSLAPLVMAPAVVSRTLSSRERRDCPPIGDFDAAGHCALLSQLVYPLSPADFRGRHWRSCALAVHGPAERIKGLGERMLHQLSLRRLLDATPSEEIHVWLRANRDPQHATASAANGASRSAANKSFTVAETSAALSCYESGASLYFRAPPEASDLLVTALSQQLGLSFGAVRPVWPAHRTTPNTNTGGQGAVSVRTTVGSLTHLRLRAHPLAHQEPAASGAQRRRAAVRGRDIRLAQRARD